MTPRRSWSETGAPATAVLDSPPIARGMAAKAAGPLQRVGLKIRILDDRAAVHEY